MWLRRASLARTAAWPYGMYCRVEISALWNARADSLSRRYAICVFRRLCQHKERPSVGTDLVQNLRDSPTKSPTHGGLMDHAAVHGGALQLGRRWALPALTCSFVGHSLSRLGRPAWATDLNEVDRRERGRWIRWARSQIPVQDSVFFQTFHQRCRGPRHE